MMLLSILVPLFIFLFVCAKLKKFTFLVNIHRYNNKYEITVILLVVSTELYMSPEISKWWSNNAMLLEFFAYSVHRNTALHKLILSFRLQKFIAHSSAYDR